ncbi:fused (3R)-hydroxyacyl-ACP dehydratase subunits HadA/HadB [Nocardia sp. NPDC050710]|uniref:fused (3R)-hydroxyacyl-ACP dehydratase subunits HadA/HadB n=1 Tax=Nocardia sp. NPDC050710 TaxID=3157220 RepID=UPI0033D1A50A
MEVVESLRGEVDPIVHIHSLVGQRFRVHDRYEVGREKIREYARAVQDFHPVHWDEDTAAAYGYPSLVAPPTFTGLLVGSVLTAMSKILVSINLTTTVQTDQVLDFHQPLLVGDEITSNISLYSYRQAFGGDIIVIENAITNQREELVVTAYATVMARSETTTDSDTFATTVEKIVRQDLAEPAEVTPWPVPLREPQPPTPSARVRGFDSVSVGMELPGRTVGLSLGDLINYTGVSGDPNPIHWHTEAAELVGLERGVVAHGMLTMALGAGYITSWVDDPGALRQYCVRLTSPVYVGADGRSEIEYHGKVKSVDPETRTATIALTATHAGKKIFGRATATVQLS